MGNLYFLAKIQKKFMKKITGVRSVLCQIIIKKNVFQVKSQKGVSFHIFHLINTKQQTVFRIFWGNFFYARHGTNTITVLIHGFSLPHIKKINTHIKKITPIRTEHTVPARSVWKPWDFNSSNPGNWSLNALINAKYLFSRRRRRSQWVARYTMYRPRTATFRILSAISASKCGNTPISLPQKKLYTHNTHLARKLEFTL